MEYLIGFSRTGTTNKLWFFSRIETSLTNIFSILKLWVNKRTSSNSHLNQDQSNHFIANAEHFEIFGRKGKRNSVEHKRYQFDNISENVILTRKSLQIAMLLISPYLKHMEPQKSLTTRHFYMARQRKHCMLHGFPQIELAYTMQGWFFVFHEGSVW